MKLRTIGLLAIMYSFAILLTSCSKNSNGGATDPTPKAPFWKGYVNTQVWEHGAILGTNGQIRYYFSDTGGSMSDTTNSNVQKYNGTYTTPSGTDSIYITCSSTSGGVQFTLRGKYNSAKTSITGTWKMSVGGITNTLPFSLAYLQ